MEQSPETPQRILYETLPPLSLSTPDQSPTPPSDHLEPYSVFRNKITISSLRSTSPDTAAPNFISLDVAADEAEPKSAWDSPAPEPKTPAPEPKLESGWFRGRSKFKSPMLQLHKGIASISTPNCCQLIQLRLSIYIIWKNWMLSMWKCSVWLV